MKNLKLFTITLTMLMVILSINSIAQVTNSNVIPQSVLTSFTAKYPGANVKSWQTEHGNYVAKAIINDQKCFATFDENGTWINTLSKIKWSQDLPKEVLASYKATKYRSWHIDYLVKVESPLGSS